MSAVLITRPQPAADHMAERLRRAGVEVYVAPLMEYETLPNDVSIVSTCDALAFTSVQGVVEFVKKSNVHHLPVYAVGETTGAAAHEAGFTNITCADGGVPELAALLTAKTGAERPRRILHPSAEQVAEELKNILPSDMTVIRVPVYRARLISEIPPEAEAALIEGRISSVALFSPRMAAHFAQLMRRRHYKQVHRNLHAVCFSSKVAAALGDLDFIKVHISKNPDVESVMDIVTTLPKNEEDVPPVTTDMDEIDNVVLHERRQEVKIAAEKKRFALRTIISILIVGGVTLYASFILLAPEYFSKDEEPEIVAAPKPASRIAAVPRQPEGSFGGQLSSGIAQVQNATSGVTKAISTAVTAVQTAPEILTEEQKAETAESVSRLMQMLGGLRAVNSTATGRQMIAQATAELQRALIAAKPDAKSASEAAHAARSNNSFLTALMETVPAKDLGAAALLLTTVEMRNKIGSGRPFEQDLAILQKFAGDNAAMKESLTRLAPYAKSGVLSRETLAREFESVAADVVMATIHGEDISVKQRVLNRLRRLVQIRRLDDSDINGPGTEAAVARAQLLLKSGDIKGAVTELNKLQGAEAAAAHNWTTQADATAKAEDSSVMIAQSLLQNLPAISSDAPLQKLGEMIPDGLRQILTPPSASGQPSFAPSAYPFGGGVIAPVPPTFPLER